MPPWVTRQRSPRAFIESSRDPEHDACRALLALGITGTLETRHAGSAIVSMRKDIERSAGRTVIENERTGPKHARFQPFDRQLNRMPIAESASGQGLRFEGGPLQM